MKTKTTYFVYEYLFLESAALKVKRFDSLNREWLEFIKENRGKGGLQHDYDVVIGPVADNKTMETVQLYIADILTAEEAVERLKYNKANNQVSFHTEKALKSLKLDLRKQRCGFINQRPTKHYRIQKMRCGQSLRNILWIGIWKRKKEIVDDEKVPYQALFL